MTAKNWGWRWCCVAMMAVAWLGCSERKEVIAVQAGVMVPQSGIVIDVDYDPRLDSLVPGYKLLTVAIDNNTLTPLRLDSKKDRWEIQTARGRWIKVLHDLRFGREGLWRKLPSRIREMIGYPDVVGVGETGVFDLFVKSSVTLEGFRGVKYDAAQFGRIIEVQREL